MPNTPKSPGSRGRPVKGTPPPTRGAGRRSWAGTGARAQRPTPGKGSRIRYSAAKVEETGWGPRALGACGASVALIGLIGWSVYLVPPSPSGAVGPDRSVPTLSPEGPPVLPLPAPPKARPVPGDEPLSMTPGELQAQLQAEPGPGPTTSIGPYAGRLVTWSGTAISAVQLDGRLRVDLTDSDGLLITGWCAEAVEPQVGAPVTIRGRLASTSSEGFVVEHCNLL